MESLLATIGSQAMKYAIRSGIALTSKYAIGQCSRLLETVGNQETSSRLASLQKLLDSKIKVIAPAIDLVEFKSGRGNVFLDSALPLAKSLQQEIVSLGHRIEVLACAQESMSAAALKSKTRSGTERGEIKMIISDMQDLLGRLDREIPLLQLAITASGESLSSSLPAGISPSRLLQASTLMTVGDTEFVQIPTQTVQIGPVFSLSLYMLFVGHSSSSQAAEHDESSVDLSTGQSGSVCDEKLKYGLGDGERKPIWQEVIHKARVRLCRAPATHPSSDTEDTENNARRPEYAYHLEIVEDKDDGRVHEAELISHGSTGDACIREWIPIHQISKIFYTDSGRLLNIGTDTHDGKNPVLLLKRDTNASPSCVEVEKITECRLESDHEGCSGAADNEEDSVQLEIDRQLGEDSTLGSALPSAEDPHPNSGRSFPKHLDPEWIALDMFEEDYNDDESCSSEDYHGLFGEKNEENVLGQTQSVAASGSRRSLDSQLEAQIKNLSLCASLGDRMSHGASGGAFGQPHSDNVDSPAFMDRSPFGAITSSLSLIEMLIRLAGLQEFQQTSHLSIPDHILTFFLEETSTTGLVGEAQWKARAEAKRRVGFDPYTDTPEKQRGEENRPQF